MNCRTLKTEKLLSSSPSRKSVPTCNAERKFSLRNLVVQHENRCARNSATLTIQTATEWLSAYISVGHLGPERQNALQLVNCQASWSRVLWICVCVCVCARGLFPICFWCSSERFSGTLFSAVFHESSNEDTLCTWFAIPAAIYRSAFRARA